MVNQKKEKVGVCIPTYNQAQFIEASIMSALNQIGPFEVEVWVSNDASTDNTDEVMKKLCSKDKRIHYYKQPKNIGIAENRSWVLSQPDTEFVVNLDSDDVLKEEFLLTLVPKLHQYPDAGYAHAQCEIIDKKGLVTSKRKLFRNIEFLDSEKALKESITGLKTTCSMILFKKKALQKANFFKNRPSFGEDYDLTVRLADLGFGNVHIKSILCQYRSWTNYRQQRHNSKIQIEGLCRIFEESIIPAFKKRNWDIQVVNEKRKVHAILFSIALVENRYLSIAEKQEIKNLLLRLGDSFSLRLRFFLYKIGFGKFFMMKNTIILYTKNLVKNLLMRRSL